jgi:hypothetical protein
VKGEILREELGLEILAFKAFAFTLVPPQLEQGFLL